MSNRAVGDEVGLSRERIRALVQRGLDELKEQDNGSLREFVSTDEESKYTLEHFQEVLASWKRLVDDVSQRTDAKLDRRRAASILVRDIFIDLSPQETTDLFDRWTNACNLGIKKLNGL